MTHVAIIGGGVIGATIAYELSKNPELTTSLYEENSGVQGATKAALGVLVGISSQKKSGRAWQLREKSIQRYPHLIAELEYLTKKSIPHNSQGLVHLCFSPEALVKWQQLQKIRHSQGWSLEIWQPTQLAQKCPGIQLHDDLIAAVYSPADWQINPLELTQALLLASSIGGVNLHFGQKVTHLVIEEDSKTNLKRASSITLSNGDIKPVDFLVIAAGLGTIPLTINLKQDFQMQPVLGQAMQLQLQGEQGDFQPVITGEDIHIIPLGMGKYWLGATVEFPNSDEQVIPDQQLLPPILARAIDFFPALAQAQIISTWSGSRPRPVGLLAPIIEQLTGYSNIILSTGHYRNGVLLAPATAFKVKELIQENS